MNRPSEKEIGTDKMIALGGLVCTVAPFARDTQRRSGRKSENCRAHVCDSPEKSAHLNSIL
jgi:hypothetical protein